jgi:ketosteroid isomerase-like protein
VGALALAALRLRRDTARAMSQENLEIVRRSFEAFQRGGPDAMLDLFSDDVITYRADPDGATFDGKAGFRDAAADWTEDFSEWQVLPQEFTDLGERVLVRVLQIAQGRSSGVRVEEDYWFLFELTGSKVSKLSFYSKHTEALEAAGLRE